MDNNISKKEKLKVIIEKYLQLQLLIKNFSTYDINFNRNIFDICLSEIRLHFNKCIGSLNEYELQELIDYYTEKYSKVKSEITKMVNDIIFINSNDVFKRIDNLEKYSNLYIVYNNKCFECSFYFETIRRLEYYLDLKNKDIEHTSKMI